VEEIKAVLNTTEVMIENMDKVLAAIIERLLKEAKGKEDKTVLEKFQEYTKHGGELFTASIDKEKSFLFEEELQKKRILSYQCEDIGNPKKSLYILKGEDVREMYGALKQCYRSGEKNESQQEKIRNSTVNRKAKSLEEEINKANRLKDAKLERKNKKIHKQINYKAKKSSGRRGGNEW
jgi:hypothetical protein